MTLELTFACGESSLSVRRFSVHEAISSLFSLSIWARSANPSLDLEAIVGKPAGLRLESGMAFARAGVRTWTGVCSSIELAQAVQPGPGEAAISTYHLRIVPALWLLGQRRNHRIFQHLTIPDITDRLLAEWSLDAVWQIDRGRYPKLEYKVQYGESDLDFLCRLWEEAGIAFTFPDDDGISQLTLGDTLHVGALRPGDALPYADNPNQAAEREFVTDVRLSHEVRPGAYAIRDHDFRNPGFKLLGEAPREAAPPTPEHRYEQYHYRPGAFLIETGKGGGTPVADDQGVARHDQAHGGERAARMLGGERTGRRTVSFDTNAVDLRPGALFAVEGHPHAELGGGARLLVTSFSMEGAPNEEWILSGQAVFADVPYVPPQRTPKPRVEGVQSATVVGPAGQEIHTDEFGRVRVQFPWDREGKSDERSSCWIRVSQGWAGTGYGMIVIPRIGQEVLVGFLAGDPDQPIIVGRVFNATQGVPYKLPEHRTRSTWKSNSSLGGGGFNEIMFEDLKGKELVYVQAEKNLRKLVKHDETITVGRNRQKLVVVNETETTGVNRTEVTGVNRTEITGANRTTVIGGDSAKLVKASEAERTEGNLTVYVGQDQDIVIKQVKRERVGLDSHLVVRGNLNEQVHRSRSLTVGKNRHEQVGRRHALEAGKEIHLKAGSALVIEAAKDLTIKGPGGFIRIDDEGVTIHGKLVKINSGGAPGSGAGASPLLPEDALEAQIAEPEAPAPDNVARTGLAQ